MITTQQMSGRKFKVLWNGEATRHTVIDGGSRGYGIITGNREPNWVGSWDSAMKMIARWLTMPPATIFRDVQSPAERRRQKRSDFDAQDTKFSRRFQQCDMTPPAEVESTIDEYGMTQEQRQLTADFADVIAARPKG